MLHGSYDYRLVALSAMLAIMAAFAALELAGRIAAAQRYARLFWLAGGATAMGVGIWSTHYIAMLAFSLPVPVLYHYPTVILSLLVAIAASAVALETVSRERMGVLPVVLGSLAMGGGISAMHYIGMNAMRLPAMMEYRASIVALSVILAVAISLVALLLTFRIRHQEKVSLSKLAGAVILGSAVPLMHYAGMWAVRFHPSSMPFRTQATVQISSLSIAVISASSLLVMLLAIVTAFVDRLWVMQTAIATAARDGEARLRILAEAIPLIIWTATPEGAVDYCNQRLMEATGTTADEILGWKWASILHPDDQPLVRKHWEQALQTGTAYEIEYRVRNREGIFRWYLVRATPLRDSTEKITKWFGSCADIDDQMRHQQVLEERIKEHTAALMDANNRLEREMRERALAQQELNRQNERMVRELTRRSHRATTLSKMAELLQSCANLPDVFAVVAGMAPKVFPELRGAVLMFNSGRDLLEVQASWADCRLPATVFEAQDCWALRTGHLHVVPAGDRTAECKHAASVPFSYFCLPLLSQGEAIGVLHFQCSDCAELPETELSLAANFAEQVGLSVANIRLREALRNQSIRDPLTGLFNRRYLEETMERETRRAVRAEHGLGVLMLDLDHFKKFNDTYGHDAGDTVLRETAAFLTKSVRAEDIVCRFGGEEFVIILPMADLHATEARAERIRSHLRELTVLHQGQFLGMVTVSVGIAALPQHGTDPKTLIAASDAALYRAKRDGRDRVAIADLPASEDLRLDVAASIAAGSASLICLEKDFPGSSGT
ncbi:MAG TPA: diguanylate cyclase [Candidatus Sulfotelmatobacter sp.]|nr:diguanylate cyclase [Candidatus Sulfotelmatobacter sp.]